MTKIPEMVSTNKIYAGMHHSQRTLTKNSYKLCVGSALNKNGRPKITLFPVVLVMRFTFEDQEHQFDSSNCSFMGKCIEDSLVWNKVLPGDSPKYVDYVTYKSILGEEEMIEVWIETEL